MKTKTPERSGVTAVHKHKDQISFDPLAADESVRYVTESLRPKVKHTVGGYFPGKDQLPSTSTTTSQVTRELDASKPEMSTSGIIKATDKQYMWDTKNRLSTRSPIASGMVNNKLSVQDIQ